MSWIEKLYETYESCLNNQTIPDSASLLPIAHTTQQAHIEIIIDQNGKFKDAKVLENKQDQKTLIPCTESSAGRSGKKPENHPLCDKLQYVAGDFSKYGGKVTVGFSGDPREPYNNYRKSLVSWCESSFTHVYAAAILAYVKSGHVVKDLIDAGVLPQGEGTAGAAGSVLSSWDGDRNNAPLIFRALPPGQGPMDAFVRFRVRSEDRLESGTWETPDLIQSWIDYYTNRPQSQGLCIVQGTDGALAEQHPAKIRHDADKAKLISSNDTSGFTFRGRFVDAAQAAGVSFETTQKAHNALRWLIRRKQAFRNDTQVLVSWAIRGSEIPSLHINTLEFLTDQEELSGGNRVHIGDAGQAFALRLRKKIAGYRTKITDSEDIVVMGIDSATPGRMAITFYRELTGSEFLERLERWHLDFSWFQNYGRELHFIGAPSPRDIAWACFGKQVDGKNGSKLLNFTIERLLPCIIDGTQIPRDLVIGSEHRTSNRVGLENWEWEKCLGIACALYRGTNKDRRYQMGLEEDRKARDYLYGRLLAIAERIESVALSYAHEQRDTTAARLMQRFSDRPYSTWRNIRGALVPYEARINAKTPGLLLGYKELLDQVHALFSSEDFTSDHRLSGEYLLGYHCQRKWLYEHRRSEGRWVIKEATDTGIQEANIEA